VTASRRPRRILAVTVIVAAAAAAAWPSGEPAVAQALGDPIVFAAGDIACGSDSGGGSCRQMETSNLFVGASPDAVLPLGDVQYEAGQLSNFQSFYDPSWGRAKAVTRPAIGNHELNEPAGQGRGYWTTTTARACETAWPASAARATTATTSAPGT
jgi:hypothetical protein